jgi:hypothetical protein
MSGRAAAENSPNLIRRTTRTGGFIAAVVGLSSSGIGQLATAAPGARPSTVLARAAGLPRACLHTSPPALEIADRIAG